ncbi:5-(carboxyamino)imidazole ribonucleotide synthase [Tumidithrix helvetica]|uniref:5-(carboxyamino)imidazole ribonucleotide synthase n=1 Tax=Tumidithrix helvetica TaxID=3457545 RepID=UPI003CC5082D
MKVKRVGVIGGGQLAWMMAIAAKPIHLQLVVQAGSQEDASVRAADRLVLGAVNDFAATEQLAALSDVITFENEFVNIEKLQKLASQGVKFLPSLETLTTCVDKYLQRLHFQQQGIPTPKFFQVDREVELLTAARSLGYPLVLKARRNGYDGKGTWVVKSESELLEAWTSMAKAAAILEEFVPFERELATIAVRSESGEVAIYPVVETEQENQVCRRVLAPARIQPSVAAQVEAIAGTMLTSLNAIGVFGIEFFLTKDGKVSVNEIAPRTHNSGHYTIEACATSQFEQLLRIVSGMPLGSIAMTSPVAVMINLLGFEDKISDYALQRQALAQLPNTHVHWYGKTQSKVGRKLGHVTVLAETYEQGLAIGDRVNQIWQ